MNTIYLEKEKKNNKAIIMAISSSEEQSNSSNPTKVKKANLAVLAITQLLGGLTFSLLSPFYTEEATQKVSSIYN